MLEQARNQHLRFGGSKYILGEKDFCFYIFLLYVLIKHFLRTIKFGRPKIFGGNYLRVPPVATGLCWRNPVTVGMLKLPKKA